MFKILLALVCSIVVTSVNVAAESRWSVEHSQSEIRFEGIHAGNGFAGVFEKWEADIDFDPENLESATVRVLIDTSSAVTGNALYDGTLKGEDWFDVASHQTAVFEASRFEKLANNQYLGKGQLTIKDNSSPIELTFQLEIRGDQASMTAVLALDRIQFGLGVSSDGDAAWVSREISLQIKLNASKHEN